MTRNILLAPAMLAFLLLAMMPASAASRADKHRPIMPGYAGSETVKGDIAELRFRQWREPFQPFVYPEYPPVRYSGPRHRFYRDRNSNAYERRKCARTTGYRTDDYYNCVGPWWWPFLR
jgi:hypothetical protein